MSFTKDTARIPPTEGLIPNMEKYNQYYEELRPRTFLKLVRRWDEQFPLTLGNVFTEDTAPDWAFRWPIYIEPRHMTPFTEPNTQTPMITAAMKYEDFVCRQIKEGFWVNTFEIKYPLIKSIIPERTRMVRDAQALRIEYSLVQAAMGNTWNNQNNARMSAGNALVWTNPNSTPIGDILQMQTYVYQMCQRRPSNLFLGWTAWQALLNHPAILNQMLYTRRDLLTNGMIEMIKGLQIHVVEGYYKEASDESNMVGAPGRGDVREDISPTEKHWLLEDVALVTTSNIGKLFRATGEHEGVAQWEDVDKSKILYKLVRAFCPVIEDYARVGRIDFVTDSNDVDLYTSQGAEGFWGG
ncbi:hypothetical protein DRH29_02750 [candidate division Kazan bacterium]|uniref:Uncharacterized protein n=1 Tax=candidate division Kazan bacterium TaxID=2202143 RepID=A0A420ZCN7_UNCK3|nr:MAG: hypothetical protein DRH29_02750 [candidate division Kazan bacterium]